MKTEAAMIPDATAPPAVFSPLLHHYTLEEVWALPDPTDRSYYELIGGVLFMKYRGADSGVVNDDPTARYAVGSVERRARPRGESLTPP